MMQQWYNDVGDDGSLLLRQFILIAKNQQDDWMTTMATMMAALFGTDGGGTNYGIDDWCGGPR